MLRQYVFSTNHRSRHHGMDYPFKFPSHDPWKNADSVLISIPSKNKIVIKPITILKWRYPYNFKSICIQIIWNNFQTIIIISRFFLEQGSKDRNFKSTGGKKLSPIIKYRVWVKNLNSSPEVQFRIQHNYYHRSFYILKKRKKNIWNLLIETFNLSSIFHQNFWFKRKSH